MKRTYLFNTTAMPQVLLRSPDEHPNPAAPTGEPVVDPNAGPGVERVSFPGPGETGAEKPPAVPAGDETQEEGPPEGYESWKAYAQALAEGKATPGKEDGAGNAEPTSEAAVEAALQDLPEASREKAKPFFEEFATTGTLTAESKKAAAEAFGVSEAMVDQYMAGYQATEAQEGAQLLATAGVSQEDFNGFKEWAEANQTPAQRVAFNEGLEKDPSKTLQDAITAWKESGSAPGPRDITRSEAQERGATGKDVTGYGSPAEMTRDMADPKYRSDPAFRAQVEKKVAASDFSLGRDVGNL